MKHNDAIGVFYLYTHFKMYSSELENIIQKFSQLLDNIGIVLQNYIISIIKYECTINSKILKVHSNQSINGLWVAHSENVDDLKVMSSKKIFLSYKNTFNNN